MTNTTSAFESLLRVEPDWSEWISAGRTRNYMLGDPILDWLDQYGLIRGEDGLWSQKNEFWHGFYPDYHPSNPCYLPETDFTAYIMAKGHEFEDHVIDLITNRLSFLGSEPVKKVAVDHDDIRRPESVTDTLELMRSGAPVIHQGVLWDFRTKTFGAPDLLVRSDYLNAIAPNTIDQREAQHGAPLLGTRDWHYKVVDVKYTTLPLNFCGEVGNERRHNKAQVALYNNALGELQGFSPPSAYLLGRGWRKGKDERGASCLDLLGEFSITQPQYQAPDIDWLAEALIACDWIRRVRRKGHQWLAAGIPELRPNMCNGEDSPWHLAKREIARATGEITQLWQIGAERRDHFIDQFGVTDWKDPNVSAVALQLTSEVYGPRLDRILWINRDADAPLVYPEVIASERESWLEPAPVEFFVDFETCSDLDDDFTKLPEKGGQPLIFTIGCGHIEEGQWVFESFVADRLEPGSERAAIIAWIQHMEDVRQRLAPELTHPQVFHWSPAEESTLTTAYNSARSRHGDAWPEPNWFDFLNRVVKPKKNPDCIAVKGAMGFGLKAMGTAMHTHGLISTKWTDGPTDGLGAMTGAWWCYREADRRGIHVFDVETEARQDMPSRRLFVEIANYNEIDCRVMYEAIHYFRSNH